MDDVTTQQRVVQQRLGRCTLRLQQHEHLLRQLLVHHEVSGTPGDYQIRHAQRVKAHAKLAFGDLVEALFEKVATVDTDKADKEPEVDGAVDEVFIRLRFQVGFTQEAFRTARRTAREVVKLRNTLAHRFVLLFDIWTAEGCRQATAYLDDAYGRIDASFLELQDWARALDRLRREAGEASANKEFLVLALEELNGPDLNVAETSDLVSALSRAEVQFAVDGWTPLEDAIEYLDEVLPAESPTQYGCQSWSQVLAKSGLYEVQYLAADGAARALSFRRLRHA